MGDEQSKSLLTDLLVAADEGKVKGLVVAYEDESGEWRSVWTGCERKSVVAAQLMRLAMERMDFVREEK